MKRLISILGPSALAVAMLCGCASKQTPAELRDARAAYKQAQEGPAGQSNRAGVMEARQALDRAERKFADDPGSDDVKTLAYVAQRKAQIAEADGRAEMAKDEQAALEKQYLQIQTAQAQKEAEMQRQAAGVSERRAKVALDQLGLAAKDEPRGTVITLPDAGMFATNKADILPEAKKRLTDVADAVKKVIAERAPQDAGRKIELIGHTDDRGTDEHNMKLSKRRAESVRKFFVSQGIDASMLEADGRGKDEPIAGNDTPQGRSENRRVEIVITRGGGLENESMPNTPAKPEKEPKAPKDEPLMR